MRALEHERREFELDARAGPATSSDEPDDLAALERRAHISRRQLVDALACEPVRADRFAESLAPDQRQFVCCVAAVEVLRGICLAEALASRARESVLETRSSRHEVEHEVRGAVQDAFDRDDAFFACE